MADKPKKRLKIRFKEGEDVKTPEGYIPNPGKSNKRKKVFDLLEGQKTKIKLKAGQDKPEIPEGYILDPEKSKGKSEVYINRKELEAKKSSESQFREPTEEERKRMESGDYYGKNFAEYRDDVPSKSTKVSELIIKKKEPKYKEEGPSTTSKERRESRRAYREMNKTERKFKQGCPVGKGRISRARY